MRRLPNTSRQGISFGYNEDPEDYAQRGMRAMFQSTAAKQQDIADNCTNKIVEVLDMITVNRNNQIISVYQIIEEILKMKNVSKLFIEGSSVMYMYDKFCQGKPDNELVRPGDIDLHVEYEGDWTNFTTSNDKSELDRISQIETRLAELIAREKEILAEKTIAAETLTRSEWKSYHHSITPILVEIHNEKTELIPGLVGRESRISEMLGLRSDSNIRSFAITVDMPWLSDAPANAATMGLPPLQNNAPSFNPGAESFVPTGAHAEASPKAPTPETNEPFKMSVAAATFTPAAEKFKAAKKKYTSYISKSIDLDIQGKGGINWKSNPQVELTVIDQITKEKYKNNIKNGFIVSDIPKLNFTRGEVLKIHRSAPPPQLEFENVSSNYTGISFTDPDGDLYKCNNFIKAFELYLRYKSSTSLGELSDNPLIKFSQPNNEHHQLKCLQDLPEEIANWKGNEITLSECNKFLCGLIILISSKHEEDTIKTMLHKLKVMLINTYRNVDIHNTEMQITTYFLTCCVPCMTTGLCKREDCGNNIDRISAHISEILKEVFDLGKIHQTVFKNKVKRYITDSDILVRKDGYATGKKRKRQTRKKNKNKVTKRRRNKKGKSKRNKAKKTKRM